MVRKRIAVLTAQSEEKTPNEFVTGFLEQAFEYNYDVCIFNMNLKFQETPLRGIGDSNIYNLINFKMFDGFVIMTDRIQTPGAVDKILDKVRDNFNGPVLIVDRESEYFETVMMDHYTPFLKLIDHLIEVHGYKDIVYVSGLRYHPHAIQREKGYRDSMANHGITVSEDNVFYGDWNYKAGRDVVDTLVKHRDYLPEAIACANDEMAIGAAEQLEKYGYRIPQDIAVIGYDSIEEGLQSPTPLTSADIPAKECGMYSARWIHASLNGEKLDEFRSDGDILIGGSCGCEFTEKVRTDFRRKKWATESSTDSYKSNYNHLMDDLLSATLIKEFYNTVFQYVHQIRSFDRFYICMNDYWNQPSIMTGDEALREGYTEYVYPIIKCGPDEDFGNVMDFDNTFRRELLLPELHENSDKPRAFFFTPIHFDDRCFGYAVLSYGNNARSYTGVYLNWLKSIMQGMESFYRQASLAELINKIEATQIRDSLTGLYNYRGFIKMSGAVVERAVENDECILAVAIDISKISDINMRLGRNKGDEAILNLSRIISDCAIDGMLCSRLCDDEFVCAMIVEDESLDAGRNFLSVLERSISDFNSNNKDNYEISISSGISVRKITTTNDMEMLVNSAVAKKNNIKSEHRKMDLAQRGQTEEEKNMDKLVADILDNNKLIYHFQPIVLAKTGEIYAYEALMRANVQERVSPADILQSAERMDRMADVERATFKNVLNYIEGNEELFKGKKIFINSIPGCVLDDADKKDIDRLMSKYNGKLVVEFTEETQMGDEQLDQLKTNYRQLNVDTAIDDYGTGYSNINNLLRYMPRYVKIDRVLMEDINENPQKQHFVKNIIEFAHDNDIITLAEGIETSQELKEVIKYGVDLIQGYYTARPNASVIQIIGQSIINEIVQYNQMLNMKASNKTYYVKGDQRVSIVGMAADKVNHITISNTPCDNEIEIVGAVGFQFNINLSIADGFKGTVCLNNVSFESERDMPCIEVGNNCNIVFRISGDNDLKMGGIKVPESSSVTFIGDGKLNITVNSGKYYCIGNSLNERHGKLSFCQDGEICIVANGMRGVAIGSGLGGTIEINKGSYYIDVRGQYGVGIGSIHNDTDLKLTNCNIKIINGINTSVCVGSYYDNANTYIENLSLGIDCNGTDVVGIGALYGKKSDTEIVNADVYINVTVENFYGIGGKNAETGIIISHSSCNANIMGKNAFLFGNDSKQAAFKSDFSSIISKVNNNAEDDFSIDYDKMELKNVVFSSMHNDKSKSR